MAEETVELGINNSPLGTEQPKCTKCVDPIRESQKYKDWFSQKDFVGAIAFVAFVTVIVLLITDLIAWAFTSNQSKAINIAVWPALGVFVGLMLLYVGEWLNDNLYIGYEKDTGRPHFHRKPFAPFLETRIDLPNGEQTIQKTVWLEKPILRLPLGGGRFRMPVALEWDDEMLFHMSTRWQICSGGHGVLDVTLRNTNYGDRISITPARITSPLKENEPHIIHFLRGEKGLVNGSAAAAFEEVWQLSSKIKELEAGAEETHWVEINWDRLGTTVVGVVEQLQQSRGERKSRPAELAREGLEAGLNKMPPEQLRKWRRWQNQVEGNIPPPEPAATGNS